jgi:hypothetical protein
MKNEPRLETVRPSALAFAEKRCYRYWQHHLDSDTLRHALIVV